MQLAPLIEHTLLRPDACQKEFETLVEEASAHRFHGVCVASSRVSLCDELRAGRLLKIVSVVAFPLGSASAAAKEAETAAAVAAGADEIDVPINRGLLLDGSLDAVRSDLGGVVRAALGRPVKVILETSELNQEQIALACDVCRDVGASFVKTATGFGRGGATPEGVAYLKALVGDVLGVKASGGIRSRAQAESLVAAGATRIGASHSTALIVAESAQAPSSDGY